jgi:hypothetical protein
MLPLHFLCFSFAFLSLFFRLSFAFLSLRIRRVQGLLQHYGKLCQAMNIYTIINFAFRGQTQFSLFDLSTIQIYNA